MKTILISGGHLTPALAVIDQAEIEKKSFRFVFLGRTYSQEHSKQLSHEQEEVEKRNITFIPTIAPKFHKTYWWRNLSEIGKWYPALKIAWQTVSTYKPDVFISFGGYLAFPIALVCRVRNIPILTHEQTTSVGLANKFIAMLSTKVAVSHKSTQELFPEHKTVLTGNPVRPSLLKTIRKKPSWIKKTPDKPILYITGGNQGSEILNTVVAQTMSKLASKWFVIHQCGNPNTNTNYEKRLQQVADSLHPTHRNSYIVRAWIHEEELSWILSQARLVVSRSGANTVKELTIHEIPAVFIPLPFSHNNEQYKNAEMLEKAGSAVILPQHKLNPETFLDTIHQVSRRHRSMSQKAALLKSDMILDGASRVIQVVETMFKEKKFYIEKE